MFSRFTILSFLLMALIGAYAADKPNVVIFYTDDQGTIDTNSYGSKDLYTPNMDKLAETGISFTQAYAHIVCCPSRAMLMTGRYPHNSGALGFNRIQPGVPTLPETLRDHGYYTGILGKTEHVVPSREHTGSVTSTVCVWP